MIHEVRLYTWCRGLIIYTHGLEAHKMSDDKRGQIIHMVQRSDYTHGLH